MATRTSKAKKLNKVQAWGIVQVALNGALSLVAIANGRQDIRNTKREMFPGSDYKTVKVNATLSNYTK